MIKVLYFASFREQLDNDLEQIDAAGLPDVGSVLHLLRSRGAPWTSIFSEDQRVMMAVNQEVAEMTTSIQDGDEIAFFPPVTGG